MLTFEGKVVIFMFSHLFPANWTAVLTWNRRFEVVIYWRLRSSLLKARLWPFWRLHLTQSGATSLNCFPICSLNSARSWNFTKPQFYRNSAIFPAVNTSPLEFLLTTAALFLCSEEALHASHATRVQARDRTSGEQADNNEAMRYVKIITMIMPFH
jgi:hypothetical protein